MTKEFYKIYRWDGVIFGNREYPTPVIYIKPDNDLLEFSRTNNNALLINISGSGSVYDNKNITGVMAKSLNIPNCRPVFFKETGLYVIVLNSIWFGYPNCLGKCKIL